MLMSKEDFDLLSARGEAPCRAYLLSDMPAGDKSLLLKGLDAAIDGVGV